VRARRAPWAGWLPDPVQDAANAAARAGLIPLVCDDEESFDLYAPGDVYLGCVGDLSPLTLFLDELDDDGECIEIRGLDAVLAWISTAPAGDLAERTLHDPDRT
jgi:hypothetical protein